MGGTHYNATMNAGYGPAAPLLAARAQDARCARGEHDGRTTTPGRREYGPHGVPRGPGERWCARCKTPLPAAGDGPGRSATE